MATWQDGKKFRAVLGSILKHRPPPSQSAIRDICAIAAHDSDMWYKHVVVEVVRFMNKAPQQHKISALYIIDAICRLSRKLKHDVYPARFASASMRYIPALFECPDDDLPKVARVLKLWELSGLDAGLADGRACLEQRAPGLWDATVVEAPGPKTPPGTPPHNCVSAPSGTKPEEILARMRRGEHPSGSGVGGGPTSASAAAVGAINALQAAVGGGMLTNGSGVANALATLLGGGVGQALGVALSNAAVGSNIATPTATMTATTAENSSPLSALGTGAKSNTAAMAAVNDSLAGGHVGSTDRKSVV